MRGARVCWCKRVYQLGTVRREILEGGGFSKRGAQGLLGELGAPFPMSAQEKKVESKRDPLNFALAKRGSF